VRERASLIHIHDTRALPSLVLAGSRISNVFRERQQEADATLIDTETRTMAVNCPVGDAWIFFLLSRKSHTIIYNIYILYILYIYIYIYIHIDILYILASREPRCPDSAKSALIRMNERSRTSLGNSCSEIDSKSSRFRYDSRCLHRGVRFGVWLNIIRVSIGSSVTAQSLKHLRYTQYKRR